jgi:hypothetical protein
MTISTMAKATHVRRGALASKRNTYVQKRLRQLGLLSVGKKKPMTNLLAVTLTIPLTGLPVLFSTMDMSGVARMNVQHPFVQSTVRLALIAAATAQPMM